MRKYDDVIAKYNKHNKILFSRDSLSLNELLSLMQKQNHRTLVLWSFKRVQLIEQSLHFLDLKEKRPFEAIELSKAWSRGEVKMNIAKKAILDVHQLAKETDDVVIACLCHAIGQGCSTVHVETHAIGIAMYELTSIVRAKGIKESFDLINLKIADYIIDLLECQKIEKTLVQKWAPFLLVEGKKNKELVLYDKNLGSVNK